MKHFILTIISLITLLSNVAAQSDSLSRAQLKAEIKREILQELQEQEVQNQDKNQWKSRLHLYGFIRNYIHYDTRECIAMTGELFNLVPKDVELNEKGEDINDVSRMLFTSFTSRLGVDVTGPRLLNAQSSAKLEADFCGFSPTNTLFRIRHAYIQLDWKRLSLLLGQTWHPTFNVYPSCSSYSAGAPFSASSRSPQLRLTWDAGHNWETMLSLLYQVPDMSVGPNGKTYDYARWNIWPEVYASIAHHGKHFTFGAGVTILSLKPRKSSTAEQVNIGPDGTTTISLIQVPAHDRVLGISPEIFADYKYGLFNIKGKVTYAENTSHLTMISGFGATDYNPQTGSYKYAPLRSVVSWLNLTYGKKFMGGIFLGYLDNLGAKKDFISTNDFWVYAAKNIDYVYRIAPSITFFAKNLEVGLEGDYTVAGYGDEAIDGNTKALRDVGNLRVSLMVRYRF